MIDPITFELTIGNAIALLIIAIPAIVALYHLIKIWRSDKIKTQMDDLKAEVSMIKSDLESYVKTVNTIHQSSIHNEISRSQVADLRIAIGKLQDKMEKITDLIITMASKD